MDKEAIISEYMASIGSIGGSRSTPAKTAANKIKAKLPRKPRKSALEHTTTVLDNKSVLQSSLDQG